MDAFKSRSDVISDQLIGCKAIAAELKGGLTMEQLEFFVRIELQKEITCPKTNNSLAASGFLSSAKHGGFLKSSATCKGVVAEMCRERCQNLATIKISKSSLTAEAEIARILCISRTFTETRQYDKFSLLHIKVMTLHEFKRGNKVTKQGTTPLPNLTGWFAKPKPDPLPAPRTPSGEHLKVIPAVPTINVASRGEPAVVNGVQHVLAIVSDDEHETSSKKCEKKITICRKLSIQAIQRLSGPRAWHGTLTPALPAPAPTAPRALARTTLTCPCSVCIRDRRTHPHTCTVARTAARMVAQRDRHAGTEWRRQII
ncbi:hypothetical protein GGX14DRAFT_408687 [Mycena pura]|uniref:Uncharacterized protein n=1 Tax=Mycena pura TaxID=153505 RepID=A0AAD6UMC6_9AGAR|nr:hypothetical protein GGX14DRAFT_408687 [Mycena pura]